MLVSQNLDVGSEDCRSCHGLGDHLQVLKVRVSDGQPQHEEQDYNQRRVDPFDSAAVEVEVGEAVAHFLLDEDLSDEVARNHEENIHADEAASEELRPSVENDHDADCDSPESIDVRSVIS